MLVQLHRAAMLPHEQAYKADYALGGSDGACMQHRHQHSGFSAVVSVSVAIEVFPRGAHQGNATEL